MDYPPRAGESMEDYADRLLELLMQRDKIVKELTDQLAKASCAEDTFDAALLTSGVPSGFSLASSSTSGVGPVALPGDRDEAVVISDTVHRLSQSDSARDAEGDGKDEVAENQPLAMLAEAEKKSSHAIVRIQAALNLIGKPNACLEEACNFIQVVNMDGSPANGAVQALYNISHVIQEPNNLVGEALSILKTVEHTVRDVVVLRCKFLCKNHKDRDEFLKIAAQAYNGQLDSPSHKEIRAQLLLAYHKDPRNKNGFLSNNHFDKINRGYVRPRRQRKESTNHSSCSPDRWGCSASANCSCQVPATLAAPHHLADAAAGPPPGHQHGHDNAERSVSQGRRSCGRNRKTGTHKCGSSQSRFPNRLGLLTFSSGTSGSNYQAPLVSTGHGHVMFNTKHPVNFAECLSYHQNDWRTYGNPSPCLPHNAFAHCGYLGHYHNTCTTNYGLPTMVGRAWDYQDAAALQTTRPWQVLILLELNHIVVRCDFEALEDYMWGQAIEFQQGGYRMYIRPGAVDFLELLLQETPRTCSLAFFTGLLPKTAVPIVKELFMRVTPDCTWEVEQEEWFPPSVVNQSGIRVYIFQRSEKERNENEDDPDHMSAEQSLQLLYYDFEKVWEALNFQGYNFHKQNTMLIASPKDEWLCPQNVLGMSRWECCESPRHMKNMKDRISTLFYEKPANVITWLKPGIHIHESTVFQ